MMMKLLAIGLAALGSVGLWYGYMNLNLLRGTVLFDFRYVVYAIAAFLGLSALEWVFGWIKGKVQGSDPEH